jgi:hypothetical protein
MPTVPYNPIVGSGPSDIPVPYRTDRGATPEAFGVNIGRSMEQFGVKVGQAGDTMADQVLHYQNMINESDARDAVIKYAGVEGDAITEQYLKEGPDAAKSIPDFQQKIQQARQNALDGLNPAARRVADQEITRRVSYATIDASRHAAQQGVQYSQKTADARIGLSQKDLGARDPFNDAVWDAQVGRMKQDTIDAEALRIFGPGGGPRREDGKPDYDKLEKEPQIALKLTQEMDKAYATRVQALNVDMRNPFQAQKYFDSIKDKIADDNLRIRMQDQIERQRNNVGSDQISDFLVNGDAYQRQLFKKESGGRPGEKAPTSSAGGLAQFTTGTWNELAARHPELNLTKNIGMFNPEEATRAEVVFRQENQQALMNARIEPTPQNTYMAHFLGAGGAVRFIRGMQANPDQPAANLATPEAVRANPEVFFSKDGKPRTAQDVYSRQTSGFGQPSMDVSESRQQRLFQQGDEFAERAAPGDATLKRDVRQKITNLLNQEKQRQTAQTGESTQQVLDYVSGRYGNQPILDAKNLPPQLAEKLVGLPEPQYKQVMDAIGHNSENPKALTPERNMKFQAIMSMDRDTAGEQRFLQINPYDPALDLPTKQRQLIATHQNEIRTGKTDATRHEDLNTYLNDSGISSMIHGMKWDKKDLPDADQAAYDQWTGAFEQYLKNYKAQNQKPAPVDEARTKAGQLLHATTTRAMFGVGSVRSDWLPSPFTTETRAFQVPEGYMDEPSGQFKDGKPLSRSEAFEEKYGYKPGPREAGMIHYRLEEERKKQEKAVAE